MGGGRELMKIYQREVISKANTEEFPLLSLSL